MTKVCLLLILGSLYSSIFAQKINWISIDSAFEKNEKSPKKIYIDVYTDWCYWCKVMEKKTFTNKQVINYMNAHFYASRYNAESDKKITILDKIYNPNYQDSKYNELSIRLLRGQLAFPSFNFTNEDNETIAVVPGYWKSKKFLKLLIYFAEDYYKKYNWQEYDQEYSLKTLLNK